MNLYLESSLIYFGGAALAYTILGWIGVVGYTVGFLSYFVWPDDEM